MRYHRTPARMAKINSMGDKQQILARMQRKGNPLTLLVGIQTDTATLENSIQVPEKVKNRTIL